MLSEIRSALSYVPPDDRNTWVAMAMAVKSSVGEDGFEVWDQWSQGSDRYIVADARDVWKSCKGNGATTAGTLFYEARKHGWTGTYNPEPIPIPRKPPPSDPTPDRTAAQAAAKAQQIWDAGTWAEGHPYLLRKNVPEVPSLREIATERATEILGYSPKSKGEPLTGSLLIVPIKVDDRLSTLELIDETGRKTALFGGIKKAGYWATAPLPSDDGAGTVILIGEGVATCLSAVQAVQTAVGVAALSCGNLKAVAIHLHGRYPHARFLILADLDKTTGYTDRHAVEAARAVDCAIAPPKFPHPRRNDQTDWNDLARILPPEDIAAMILPTPVDPRIPPPADTLIASDAEIASAQLTPRCIVTNHTYADVAQVVAPGGTGKTTLLIYESVQIALGRPLWGLDVLSPGWTLYISAEDQRARLLARLREILAPMDLPPAARRAAIEGFRVWDVAGEQIKLIRADGQNILLTTLADDIVTAYRDTPPAVVVFDPLVSFGASEQAINDNEQGIITAARRIVRGLNCCVRLVHHTGKGNARDGTLDQYSGRGGSALADGSRMTTVLQAWIPDTGSGLTPPQGCKSGSDSSITVMARAKLSFAPPQPLIWIQRTGYTYDHWTEQPKLSPEAALSANADQVERYLISQYAEERYHTTRSLETAPDIGMSRRAIRAAVDELYLAHRVYDAPLPEKMRVGARKTYLHCAKIPAQ
jgi:hypothetical protein